MCLWAKLLQSSPTLCNLMDCSPPGSSVCGILQNTGVGCCAVLQGIFPTQGLSPGVPHYRQKLLWTTKALLQVRVSRGGSTALVSLRRASLGSRQGAAW